METPLTGVIPETRKANQAETFLSETEKDIWAVCNEIAEMLCEKNRSYGDSALTPVRIFSKEASNIEQLNVRMDDKLSRLLKGNAKAYGEDVEKDLIGYLILKRIALRREKVAIATATSRPRNSDEVMSGL